MIRLDDEKFATTLRDASKDKTHNVFMTSSMISVIDFDKVKEAYTQNLHLTDTPLSNDALVVDKDGTMTFIEFKNGVIKDVVKDVVKFELRKKIYDSLLILTDIIQKGISYTRENVDYILVYNGSKLSRDQIADALLNKGGERFIQFGLGQFQRYCFRNVYTYTVQEFENKFVRQASPVE